MKYFAFKAIFYTFTVEYKMGLKMIDKLALKQIIQNSREEIEQYQCVICPVFTS